MFNKVIVQLLIVAVVSYFAALALLPYKIPFILGFCIGIILQYGIFNVYRYVVELYIKINIEKIETERLKLIGQKTIAVTCPCPTKTVEGVVIDNLNTTTQYRCKACSKLINVYTQVETALSTEVIQNNDIDSVDNIIKNKLNELT